MPAALRSAVSQEGTTLGLAGSVAERDGQAVRKSGARGRAVVAEPELVPARRADHHGGDRDGVGRGALGRELLARQAGQRRGDAQGAALERLVVLARAAEESE